MTKLMVVFLNFAKRAQEHKHLVRRGANGGEAFIVGGYLLNT
jgi:hypothetical protein